MNTPRTKPMNIQLLLAAPRGFCAGVDRAVEIVEQAVDLYGPPIYVRHEIVHNKYVVENLKKKGVVFVKEISEIPENQVVIFSAHGVSENVINAARNKHLHIIDATCPLVTKVHVEGRKYAAQNRKVILIGHKGHPEVEGTSGQINAEVFVVDTKEKIDALPLEADEPLAYITQTTLSVDDTKELIEYLKNKFTNLLGPHTKDICYATQNRQEAIKKIANLSDLVVVLGSKNSSNSNRLAEIGRLMGKSSYLIDTAEEFKKEWLFDGMVIGITAGASAPEILIQDLIHKIKSLDCLVNVKEYSVIEENMRFKLPKMVLKKKAS